MSESSEGENQRENNNDESSTSSGIKSFLSGIGNKLSGSGQWVAIILFWLFFVYLIASAVVDPLPTPSFSDHQLVFILTIVVGIPSTIAPVYLIISKIYNPKKEIVAKVNVTDKKILNLWYGSPELIDDMTVNSGRKVSFIAFGTAVHLVTEFDPEANIAEGVNIKEAADWEMIYDPEVVEKHRWRNNTRVRAASKMLSQLPDLGVEAESKYFQILAQKDAERELIDDSYMDTYTDKMPSPAEAEEEIEEAVQQMTQSGGDNDE